MLRRSGNKNLWWLVLGGCWLMNGLFPSTLPAQQGPQTDTEQTVTRHWWDIFKNKPEAVLNEEKAEAERMGRGLVYNEEQIRREHAQTLAVNEEESLAVEPFKNPSLYRREERRTRTEQIRALEEKRQQGIAISPEEEKIRPPLSDARSRRQARIDRAKAIKAREEANQQDNP